MATAPAAPGRFSTTTVAPRVLRACSATKRAKRSELPPAEKPTTIAIGREGYFSCACAAKIGVRPHQSRIRKIRRPTPGIADRLFLLDDVEMHFGLADVACGVAGGRLVDPHLAVLVFDLFLLAVLVRALERAALQRAHHAVTGRDVSCVAGLVGHLVSARLVVSGDLLQRRLARGFFHLLFGFLVLRRRWLSDGPCQKKCRDKQCCQYSAWLEHRVSPLPRPRMDGWAIL